MNNEASYLLVPPYRELADGTILEWYMQWHKHGVQSTAMSKEEY